MKPTSTHEQRESVRLLALQVGVREAARRLGLEQSRVQQWSKRYSWNPQNRPQNPVSNGLSVVQDCNQIVTKAADSLLNYGKSTKLNIAVSADKAAAKFAEFEGDKIIDKSDKLASITKVAATIHGWNDTSTTSALNLNVLSGGRALVQIAQKVEPNEIQTATVEADRRSSE